MFSPIKTRAAQNPHTIAAPGSTTEHPEVIETKPSSNPLQTSNASQRPTSNRRANRVVIPALEPANVVVNAAWPKPVQLLHRSQAPQELHCAHALARACQMHQTDSLEELE
ncbi:hypothetical protein Peur_002005 [Populus x canadensis]